MNYVSNKHLLSKVIMNKLIYTNKNLNKSNSIFALWFEMNANRRFGMFSRKNKKYRPNIPALPKHRHCFLFLWLICVKWSLFFPFSFIHWHWELQYEKYTERREITGTWRLLNSLWLCEEIHGNAPVFVFVLVDNVPAAQIFHMF